MTEPVTYTDGGRTYRVYGVDDRIAAITGAASTLGDHVAERTKRAREALDLWRGPHAAEFARRANVLVGRLITLRYDMRAAALTLQSLPTAPQLTGLGVEEGYARQGSHIAEPDGDGRVSAVTSLMRDYVDLSAEQDGDVYFLAIKVTTDGMWAEVDVQRPLTPDERAAELEAGVPPGIVDQLTRTRTEPVPIDEIVTLPDLSGQARQATALSAELNELAAAVADAIDDADSVRLDLLLRYPELAGFFVDGGLEGAAHGDAALAVLLAEWEALVAAAGDDDGVLSHVQLSALAEDGSLDPHVAAALTYLLENPTLLERLYGIEEWGGMPTWQLGTSQIETMLAMNEAMRQIWPYRDALDVAAKGGDTDGRISDEDLRAALDELDLPGDVRAAIQWFLDHPNQMMLAGEGYHGRLEVEAVVGLLVDQQAYAHDPQAAGAFVRDLPIADHEGGSGLPVGLVSDDGLVALANAALVDAAGDLSDQHEVISHLPESDGGIRNQLITAHYAVMAEAMDELINGPLAGRPWAEGHAGANWMMMAPWASDSVGAPIRGELPVDWLSSVFVEGRVSQAAADGNQWIYDDIGGRYAAFIELYQQHPNPTPAQLEAFFRTHFDEGDGTIQDGFAAYVASIETTDPVRRQHLLFQANSLIAIHEQAGVQVYLERVSVGPDGVAVAFVDLGIDGTTYHVDLDLDETGLPNNHVADADLLDLDPGGLGAADFSVPGGTTFGPGPGQVRLDDLGGVETWAPDFPTSIAEFYEGGAGLTEVVVTPHGGATTYEGDPPDDPDSLEGSGATSWPDRSERMWYITRLFEQTHVAPELWNNDSLSFDSERFTWLDPATGLR